MSKSLAKLMGESESATASFILGLEKISGHPAADVHLALEIDKVASARLHQLGLDPADTTAQELYQTLLSRFEADEKRFARSLGGSSRHSHNELLPLILNCLSKLEMPRSSMALKPSSAKEILKSNPPKKLMKYLNYRTVDSLLKRESPQEILAAAPYSESEAWSKRFLKECSKLTPKNFAAKPIDIVSMDDSRWGNLPKRGAIVGYAAYAGVVAVWPAKLPRTHALALTILILQAVQSVRAVGSWLEFNLVGSDFKSAVESAINGQTKPVASIGNQPVAWESLIYHYGQGRITHLPVQFEGRLTPSDLSLCIPEAVLCKVDSGLRWWLGLNYVGMQIGDKIISFNLTDVAVNFANQKTCPNASATWLHRSVRDELISRYMVNPWTEESLLGQVS